VSPNKVSISEAQEFRISLGCSVFLKAIIPCGLSILAKTVPETTRRDKCFSVSGISKWSN